jgi:hypothetical protein
VPEFTQQIADFFPQPADSSERNNALAVDFPVGLIF